MTPESLDMTDWSILDFELAYDGIRQVAEAALWLQNQPRAYDGSQYYAGADFIVELGEGWCASVLDELMGALRIRRFSERADEDRRLRLLIRDMTHHGPAGDPIEAIVQLVTEQRAA
ncbi:hypothetical protein GCM10007989_04640 [Devosia pacifica]|uniref:Uncharacterized protein n=1 Tax=Devosia pacifica TaxID=1335967 RepID=A0A918VPN3_9HYPH|nr:hypothetical protein [Devosia pacifica]GHA13137.1 hypothetical protein GCM10007989_04640 [Devosia pacifica]